MDSEYVTVTEDDITCKLCFKFFSTPILVDCLHTYCHQCIKDNITKEGSGSIFRCPQCKHESVLKDESGDSLVTDRHAIILQDIYACHSISASNCVVCSLKGETSEATQICLDCDDCLCGNCATGHNSSTATASHRVVCLDDLRRGHYDKEIMNRQRIFCSNHRNETCNIFCHTCSQPTCIPCVLVLHKDHCYEGIEDAAEKKRFTLSETLKTPAVKNSISADTLQSAQSDLDKLDKEEEDFVRNITETSILFIEKMKKESQAVLEEGRQGFHDERRRRERRKELAEMDVPKRENIVKICQRVAITGGLDVVLMEQVLQNGLMLSNQHDATEIPLITFTATFDVDLERDIISFDKQTLPKQTEGVSSELTADKNVTTGLNSVIESPETPKTTQGSQISKEKPRTDDVGYSLSINKPIQFVKNLQFTRSFKTKVSADENEPDVSGIALGTNGTCIVLDNNNAKLKVYKLTGDMAFLVEQTGKCNLFTQFVHVGNGNICALYENYLLLLSKHLKLDSKIALPSNDAMAAQPVLANFGENVIIGNLPYKEMKVFNTSGTELGSWTRPVGTKIVSMKFAGEDRVVTTTWSGNGSVNIESEEAGLLLKIQGEKRKGMKWRPTDAVVDSIGHIIVTDTKRDEISVFSGAGSHLCLFDTMINTVSQPKSLIVDKSGTVYVSYEEGQIAVYKMQYH